MARVAIRLLALLMAGWMVSAQAPTPSSSRTIRGQVIDARDLTPLRRARVVVSSTGMQPATVFADDEGRFVLDDPGRAELTIRAGKVGYTIGAAVVAADVTDTTLRFALTRSGAIEGSVRNAFGTFVTNAYVTAHPIRVDLPPTVTPSGRLYVRTDEFGDYRLTGLPPGQYELTAVRIPSDLPRSGSTLEERLFGARDALQVSRDALRVTVAPGDELRADFVIEAAVETCPADAATESRRRAGAGVIHGRVTSASGEPLACAMVRIAGLTASILRVRTDPEGFYSLEGVPPGSHVVAATKIGYVGVQHGQRHPDDRAVPVTVSARTPRVAADITLPHHAVVAGTVFDEHGEPIEGISVSAFQLVLQQDGRIGGTRAVTSLGLAPVTDDRGRYKFTVMPGTYLVAAGGAAVSASTDQARAFPSTYHPGSVGISGAQGVVVDTGFDAHGIDIRLTASIAATVRGLALDSTGRPFGGVVSIRPSADSGDLLRGAWSVPLEADGRFVVRNVPPGDYAVRTVGPNREFAMQHVTVADADPPFMRLQTSEGSSIAGTVVIDGTPASDESGITVSAYPADPDQVPGDTVPKSVLQDSRFRMAGIMGPSRLRVDVPRCEGCYMKSAFVNGVDAAERPFELRRQQRHIGDAEIVVSSRGGVIEGRVRGGVSDREAGVMIVVFSTNPDLWFAGSPYVKKLMTANRSFHMTGLPPGDYFVAAAAYDRSGGIAQLGVHFPIPTPPALERLSPRAQRVTMAEGERRSLNLEAIR